MQVNSLSTRERQALLEHIQDTIMNHDTIMASMSVPIFHTTVRADQYTVMGAIALLVAENHERARENKELKQSVQILQKAFMELSRVIVEYVSECASQE